MKSILPYLRLSCLLLLNVVSTEIYSQQWDTLAPIPESFTFPVVAVVDGKIHVMGGGGTGGATDHHFAYDPATDTWTSRAPVPYKAQQPAGTAANGKIHFFGGGFPNSGSPLDDHYIYDPATDTWAAAADLTVPRAIHYAVALNDVVYSLAGQGVTNLCQTYDPVANAWTTKNNLPDNSFFYGAHVATEGHIFRFGGGGYTAPKDLAHRYDPTSDTWAALPDLPAANHGLRGAAIGDKIFLAGGYYDFLERDEVYVFDTQTEEYSPSIPLPLGRSYHNMVAIDSCIYVIGGNHAIDQTVTFQLLRLCPFETASVAKETAAGEPLTVRYFSGKISLQLPENLIGETQFSLFDMAGKQVFSEKLPLLGTELEIQVGELPPAVYLVQLNTEGVVHTGKVVAN
ncbi:MAG: T9SS type A sorting domain-containing protein [Saprospiraceae bacterium]|nr:T9SS type A sorting domain-containing protein [Saprospiraceae bacterium]